MLNKRRKEKEKKKDSAWTRNFVHHLHTKQRRFNVLHIAKKTCNVASSAKGRCVWFDLSPQLTSRRCLGCSCAQRPARVSVLAGSSPQALLSGVLLLPTLLPLLFSKRKYFGSALTLVQHITPAAFPTDWSLFDE